MGLFHKEMSLFLLTRLVAPWKTRSKGLFLFYLTRNSPSAKVTTQGYLLKTFPGKCFIHYCLG